ncbi:MAG: protein-L-isoaspartate O-methyltransferase family protein [Lysobacteraceae bacterium]
MSIDFQQARHAMVEQQVRPWDVLDRRVLDALTAIPREDFVPAANRKLAFADVALPLAHGEFMFKPVVEGRLLQALDLSPTDEVLEIGAGSGFLTACLARLARAVVALERHADLAEEARRRVAETGAANVRIDTADVATWDTPLRFDAILVGGAVAEVPERFLGWLKPGGRLVVVRGQSPVQEAACLRQGPAGLQTESLFETDIPYLHGFAPVARFAL